MSTENDEVNAGSRHGDPLMPTIAQMSKDAAVAAAKTEARKPWADKVQTLTTALSEAATHLAQAAETLRRHGLHEKATMYDADAQTARSVLQQISA
jgi:hypothetical protein